MKKILGVILFIAVFGLLAAELVTVFESDFEDGTTQGWTIVNDTEGIDWYVGTATASTGTQSIYISSNNGVTNSYNSFSMEKNTNAVHIYREVTFPADANAITLTFDVRVRGETNAFGTGMDYLSFSLIPNASSIVAGSPFGLLNEHSTYVNYFDWDTITINLGNLGGQTRNLVFTWVNNDSNDQNPPAALDNIILSYYLGTPPPPDAPEVTIAEAKIQTNFDVDDLFKITGVALNSDGVFSGYEHIFYLQDSTGGIKIKKTIECDWWEDPADYFFIEAGNTYSVIAKYIAMPWDPDEIRFDIVGIYEIGAGVMPQPIISSLTNLYENYDQYENMLVGVQNLTVVGTWPASTSFSNGVLVDVTDGVATYPVGIFSNTGLFGNINYTTFDLQGVLAREEFVDDNFDWTYHIVLVPRNINDFFTAGTLPVTLSSFNATYQSAGFVNIVWTVESESNLRGYHLHRSETENLSDAIRITADVINAKNTSYTTTYNYTDNEIYDEGVYSYWLQAIENDGTFNFYGPISVIVDFDNDELPEIINTAITSVYPNPIRANQTVNFHMDIKSNETATLRIFNVRGQLVKEFNNIASGSQNIKWDRLDNNNKSVAPGIYFYQLSTPSHRSTQKMLIMK